MLIFLLTRNSEALSGTERLSVHGLPTSTANMPAATPFAPVLPAAQSAGRDLKPQGINWVCTEAMFVPRGPWGHVATAHPHLRQAWQLQGLTLDFLAGVPNTLWAVWGGVGTAGSLREVPT